MMTCLSSPKTNLETRGVNSLEKGQRERGNGTGQIGEMGSLGEDRKELDK